MTDELLRTWGVNVTSMREARKLSRAQLAERVGVTIPTICRWELGQVAPKDHHKVKVATVLDVDVRSLFPLIRVAS